MLCHFDMKSGACTLHAPLLVQCVCVTLKSFRTLHKSFHLQEEFYCGKVVVTFIWLAMHLLPCNTTIVLLTWIWILPLFSVCLNSVCLSRFILKWTWHSWTTSCLAKFFLVILILTSYRFDRELCLDVRSCNSFPLRYPPLSPFYAYWVRIWIILYRTEQDCMTNHWYATGRMWISSISANLKE